MIHYPSGLGGSTGDLLVVNDNLYGSGNVVYLDSEDGDDSNDGLTRERAVATLSAALTAVSAYGIIVAMSDYSESLSTNLTMTKIGVVVAGEGSSSGSPTATIGFGAAGQLLLRAVGIEFRNIKFTARSAAGALSRIVVGDGGNDANGFVMRSCRVECGANDADPAIDHVVGSANYALYENTTFISTSTTTAPDPAIECGGSQGVTLRGCTFSGGTVGWLTYCLDGTSAATGIRAQETSLLLGSVIKLHTDSDGYIHVGTVTGGSRVEW